MPLDFNMNSLAEVYDHSRQSLADALIEAKRKALAPSPKMTLSEWAEEHGRLSAENSAEPGRFRAYGYQKGLLDAMSDPGSDVVAIMKSARVGYTQLATLALGYYTEHDPTSVLFVLPTEDDAKDFMNTSVAPLYRDSPALAAILGTGEANDLWHTKYTEKGSVLRARGAHSADTFRRITSRINIGDEIDGDAWASGGAKSQGDKIKLLRKRGETFWNNKLILGSTPTIKGQSRIEDWYERGDKRRFFVECPHCGHHQILEWGGREDAHGVKWPEGKPEEAYYVCAGNGCVIEEKHKPKMIENGYWEATTADGMPGVASFHISALYSLFPKAAWGKLAGEFVEAKGDPAKLQPFVNLVLGESWEDRSAQGRRIEPHELEERALVYQAAIPTGVRFLTAGVDVQSGKEGSGGYFEVSIYGWGAGENGWLIGHWILDDEPLTSPAAWENLSNLLTTPFKDEYGRNNRIMGAAIDSGGHYTSEVYAFCDRHAARNWWAIKGRSNAKGERSKSIWPSAPSKGKGGTVYSIDQDLCKDTLYRRLNGDEEAAGALRYPAQELDGSIPIDSLFYKRLTREKPVAVQGKAGKHFWSSPSDQEPWDTLVYAYAATYGLRAGSGGNRFKSWMASPIKPRKVGKRPPPEGQGTEPQPKKLLKPARRPQVRRSSFMSR